MGMKTGTKVIQLCQKGWLSRTKIRQIIIPTKIDALKLTKATSRYNHVIALLHQPIFSHEKSFQTTVLAVSVSCDITQTHSFNFSVFLCCIFFLKKKEYFIHENKHQHTKVPRIFEDDLKTKFIVHKKNIVSFCQLIHNAIGDLWMYKILQPIESV